MAAHSIDEGSTWERAEIAALNVSFTFLLAAWGSSKGDLYTVGSSPGVIVYSPDGGKTWAAQYPGFSQIFRSVWGSGPDDVYVVGDYDAAVLHSSDHGLSWTRLAVPVPSSSHIYAVWGSGENDVYLGTSDALLHGHR